MTIIPRALCFAAEKHGDQEDKNNQAYIWHPIRVAQGLKNAGFSETHQVVGLLHDTVEDTGATLEMIGDLFGGAVLGGVDAMTRRKNLVTGEWLEDYNQYVERCCEHLIGRKVKRYDVYDNADPRRYCEGVPTGRYIKTLAYLNKLEKDDVLAEFEGRYRSQ
jgi:(p)ppGpp synthase/HD superfamily hydrolase